MSYHKKKKHPKKQSRTFFITLIVVAVLALTVGGIFYYVHSQKSDQRAQKETEPTAAERADEVSKKAQGQVALGNTDAAFKLFDDEIAKSTDKSAQAWLLVNKTTAAINGKKIDQAVTFARQAEALSPSYSTSLAMAQAAEAKGDKKSAAVHYRTTVERYRTEAKDLPFYESDLETFNAKVKELTQ